MWGGSRWTGGWEEGGGELFSFVACFLSLAAFRCFLVLLSSLSSAASLYLLIWVGMIIIWCYVSVLAFFGTYFV